MQWKILKKKNYWILKNHTRGRVEMDGQIDETNVPVTMNTIAQQYWFFKYQMKVKC